MFHVFLIACIFLVYHNIEFWTPEVPIKSFQNWSNILQLLFLSILEA